MENEVVGGEVAIDWHGLKIGLRRVAEAKRGWSKRKYL